MPSITDISGILVGHAHDSEALTGCTVLLLPAGTVGGVDVRGGAPGTHETELLSPLMTVSEVHGLALCGGSAFGLAAVAGVMRWLHEQGRGYDVRVARVPIVPAAVIFDLAIGRADRWPDAAMGYAACQAATAAVGEGCVGAGMGASLGKLLGMGQAMKSGIGSWSETLGDGTTVGALAVVNAFGDVRDEQGQIIAGLRAPQGGFADTGALLRQGGLRPAAAPPTEGDPRQLSNTTLAVIATDAALSKAETNKLAQMAQDGLARAIRPVHTPFDGDTVFALATGQRSGAHLVALGSLAADVLAQAVVRAVQSATSMGGLPSIADL
jgi:L-aminopeptidase/D-esterase-like protein